MWHVILGLGHTVARRAVPLLVGALLGALTDAGLLDGQFGATLVAPFG